MPSGFNSFLNKPLKFMAFSALILFISEWGNAQTMEVQQCLAQIEKQNKQIKQCQINQVLPDECERYLQPSILLTMQCAKNGASKQQINQAIVQGESQISGNTAESPFHKIKKKIESSPFYISSENENFIPYSSQCSEYKDKLFRIVALAINDGQAKFIVSPIKPTTCLTRTNLQKKYPVLTPEQLEKFKQGYYLEQQRSAERPYENIEVMVADSLAEAGDFFSRMKQRARLIINTEPANASIKIIGMKRAYKQGMKLNVGQYKVRVTSPTYNPRELILNLEEDNAIFNIKLTSSIEQISCQENRQDFPLELTNKYYLKKINNCTYQLMDGELTNTPFKLLVTKNTHRSKHLLKARLSVLKYDESDNVSSLTIEELKPRLSKINAGSSGVSDVPESIRSEQMTDLKNMKTRLTILNATFSY